MPPPMLSFSTPIPHTKMAKFSILFSLLVALLFVALAHASKSQQGSCDKQLERVNLDPCEQLIMDQIPSQQDEDEEDENSRIKRRVNYLRNVIRQGSKQDQDEDEEEDQDQDQDEQQMKQHLRKCCRQLKKLHNPQCQCEALQNILENRSEKLQSKKQLELVEKELTVLPLICGLPPQLVAECDLRPDELKAESRHGRM
ncbi:hypothetical protein RJT34_29045 [Clitoria ternatea]|uniref:Bifunctional inhibitor/plant lipid transfer protein/seed storage helical domain-containing protein n=1 Tax=Clitoria ternatea TaxID=43366 RepID=A0AAN9FFT2_CLITE